MNINFQFIAIGPVVALVIFFYMRHRHLVRSSRLRQRFEAKMNKLVEVLRSVSAEENSTQNEY